MIEICDVRNDLPNETAQLVRRATTPQQTRKREKSFRKPEKREQNEENNELYAG